MKWHVSEQSIYDENGQQIIEASEWYMRDELKRICNEHNAIEAFEGDKEPDEEVIKLLQDRSELIKWIGRCAWHCQKVNEYHTEATKIPELCGFETICKNGTIDQGDCPRICPNYKK